jgi:hypothetical protein
VPMAPDSKPAGTYNDLKHRYPDLEVHVRVGRVYARAPEK